MRHKVWLTLFLCLALALVCVAQPTDKEPDKKGDAKAKVVSTPTNMEEARTLFLNALELEKEQKYDDALACYNAVVIFFQKLPQNEGNPYTMAVLNNMAGIFVNQGKYQEAVTLLKGALELAVKMDNYKAMSEFCHKLGIIFSQFSVLEAQNAQMRNVITPDGKKLPQLQRILLTKGTYTRMAQVDNEFIDDRIRLVGTQNPFGRQNDLFTKLVNLKLSGDFNPNELLVPDSITFLIQIEKRGYFKVSKMKTLVPEMEYTEINEKMAGIPRPVDALITEDFYRQGLVQPDEITLSQIEDKSVGKPVQITDKEKFKPGFYRLVIKKRGYESIIEQIIMYPGEGSFTIARELKSSLRPLLYRIQSDFTAMGSSGQLGQIVPDELSLNTQFVMENAKVKPAEYKLVVRKEGYEPVLKTITIDPDERPYFITEFLKSLPRELLFQITGDYAKDELLTPDEVTLNGRFVRHGESVKPDAYRVVIRKKGYDVDSSLVLIDPKKDPYILKKMLNSTPRRIQLDMTAEFPVGQKIFPDACTLNGRDVIAEESFKPGEYNLIVKRSGYEIITKKIKIPPDDTPYVIREVLKPKPVRVETEITQEFPHDNPNLKPTLTLTKEKTKEVLPLQSGDNIIPEAYVFRADMDGYEPDVSKELIMPSEQAYKITRRLMAAPRNVISQITAEYPEGPIVPDEITLNGKPLAKDFKIKPGVHDLVILKEGYIPIRKQIRINANSADFILAERLDSKTRLVTFVFRDALVRKELNPDEVIFGTNQLSSRTLNIKPGVYPLKLRMKGYFPLEENVTIPVGSDSYLVEKFITPQQREVITEITGDFEPGKRLKPDVLALNETAIGERTTVRPGEYNLIIQKDGYFPIMGKVSIQPDLNPFEIRRIMQSKPRQINVVVKSAFDGSKITPDNLMIGDQNVKDGQELKPNKYSVLIKKLGYTPFSDQIVIEPSSQPYLLERALQALPVLVQYDIKSDFDGKPLVPDNITLGEQPIDQKTSVMPGKYALKVEKLGYQTLEEEVLIEPSDRPYVVSKILQSLEREIELKITGDFPADQPIDPEVVTLNTKDVRINSFKPGKYQLDIQMPGYVSLRTEEVITPGEGPHLIQRTLETKPRLVKEKITYDVPPPDTTPPVMTLTMVETTSIKSTERPIKEGDMLKPGSYILKIVKDSYVPVEAKKYVWPDEQPIVLEQELVAKEVVLKINLTYDIEPPTSLDAPTVSLIDPIRGFAQSVSNDNRIKPAKYFLDIQRPGYNFGTRQEIEIKPSEQPYHINKKGIAKKRSLSFSMLYQGELMPAEEIQVNGQKIASKDQFQPGTELDLMIKFKRFKTVQQRISIIPGEGPFVADVPLKPLVKYEFNIARNEEVIDGMRYSYVFHADSQPMEAQHIEFEKGVGRVYYTVWVAPEAKNLKVFGGYLFTQKSFEQIRTGIGPFTNIHVEGLIEHLKQKAQQESTGAVIPIMERLVRREQTKQMLRQCAPTEIDQLIRHLENLKVEGTERMRLKTVIDALEGLKS